MNGRKDFTRIDTAIWEFSRCTFGDFGSVTFACVWILIFHLVISGSNCQWVFSDETSAPPNNKSVKAFLAKELHSVDYDEDSYSASLPTPKTNSTSQFNDQPLPSASPDPDSRRYRVPAPVLARKMTVRRDPQRNRFVGNESQSGKSLTSIQNELKIQDQHNSLQNVQIAQVNSYWERASDLPYGKYIYVHHGPLLFEDIPLERYGQESHPCLQPVISFTKFMGTVPMVPYKITADCYAANHYGALCSLDHQGNLRPGILEGQYFPSHHIMKQFPRANVAATLVEAGTIGGIILFIP